MIILGDPAARAALPTRLVAGRPDGERSAAIAADALWRAVGGTASPWRRYAPGADVAALAVIDEAPRSQMDALLEACRAGALPPVPLAALALTGRGFRGQRQRGWVAARGNLHLTIVLPVDRPAAAIVPALIALPAVAAVEAVGALGLPLRIKWVNDLWLGGAKLGGVLAASLCRGAILERAVLGLGLNVAEAPPVPPTRFVPAISSLAAHGVAADPVSLALAILARLSAWSAAIAAGELGALIDAYRAASCVVGRSVTVWPEDNDDPIGGAGTPLAGGRVVGIDDDLSLRLVAPEHHVSRGRLALDD